MFLLSGYQELGTVEETTEYHTHPCGPDKLCGIDFPEPTFPKCHLADNLYTETANGITHIWFPGHIITFWNHSLPVDRIF